MAADEKRPLLPTAQDPSDRDSVKNPNSFFKTFGSIFTKDPSTSKAVWAGRGAKTSAALLFISALAKGTFEYLKHYKGIDPIKEFEKASHMDIDPQHLMIAKIIGLASLGLLLIRCMYVAYQDRAAQAVAQQAFKNDGGDPVLESFRVCKWDDKGVIQFLQQDGQQNNLEAQANLFYETIKKCKPQGTEMNQMVVCLLGVRANSLELYNKIYEKMDPNKPENQEKAEDQTYFAMIRDDLDKVLLGPQIKKQ